MSDEEFEEEAELDIDEDVVDEEIVVVVRADEVVLVLENVLVDFEFCFFFEFFVAHRGSERVGGRGI